MKILTYLTLLDETDRIKPIAHDTLNLPIINRLSNFY